MDAIDILGDLLGHKTSQRGRGTGILKDMFGLGSQRPSSPPKRPEEISREARELEDLLNVANNRETWSAKRILD